MKHLRRIESRTTGLQRDGITRLVNPGDIGQRLKPFVFLDFLNLVLSGDFGFEFHPHSGIATLTYQIDTEVDYIDTEGEKGTLKPMGLEWMQSGGGAWHKGTLKGYGKATGFQLWIALPPE